MKAIIRVEFQPTPKICEARPGVIMVQDSDELKTGVITVFTDGDEPNIFKAIIKGDGLDTHTFLETGKVMASLLEMIAAQSPMN